MLWSLCLWFIHH